MKYPKETTLEEPQEPQEIENDVRENIPWGKAVAGDLMKRGRAAEYQTGASGPMARTP